MTASVCSFVWHDLITTDTAAAKAFYAQVFGWSMQAFPGENEYTVVSAGSVGVGGIMPIPAQACERGAPACWQGYIAVPDVDVWAARVQAKGGATIQPPQDIPNVGRFAVVADLHGAVFILFKANASEGAMPNRPQGAPGTVGWNELHAGSGLAAFDWYSELFGWSQVRDVDMGPMGVYRLFSTGGPDAAGGMMTKMPEAPVPFWAYYFNVETLDAAMERVKVAGGKVLNGPVEVPGPMFIANCQDPQGAWFSMVAPRR
jgi:predicted enzyme related to lactoylglutathione lyase